MKATIHPAWRAILAAALTFSPFPAAADIIVRVSVKIILDGNNNRPSGGLSTDEQIQSQIAASNAILTNAGMVYRLQLSEPIVELAGKSEFFAPADPGGDPPPDPREAHLNLLDSSSLVDPTGFQRRANAVNCYINARNYSAICSFPYSGTNILLFGQGSFATSLPHEVGHYFSLLHTHQGDSGAKGQTPPQTLMPGNGDFCFDTEPDHHEWDLDDIAVMLGYSNNAQLQSSGNASLIGRSTRLWRNLMSYHDPDGRSYLSTEQIVRWTETANLVRSSVVEGSAFFVQWDGNNANNGLSVGTRWRTLGHAYSTTENERDALLIRSGTYNANGEGLPLLMNKAITLSAWTGPVTISRQ